jgi:hypothetical protein
MHGRQDPIRLQSYELSLPKTPRLKDPLMQPPPALSASIHSLRGAIDYDKIRLENTRYETKTPVLEDVA